MSLDTKHDQRSTKNLQSWADQMEENDESRFSGGLPPFKEVINGDNKITTEYKRDADGRKIKITRYYKIEQRKVSKTIAIRKNWKKFGIASTDLPGPNPANTIVSDDVFIQFISNQDTDQLDANRDNQDGLSKLQQMGNKNMVKCRYCEQDHWSTKCPYKDKLELLITMKDKEQGAVGGMEMKSEDKNKVTGGKYVPPNMREGGNKRGDVMSSSKSKDEPNTIRVTNLPEEIQDSDIRELFAPLGRVVRIFLAKDKYTGQSKGFAFVSFEKKEDAAKAIKAVNGHGYANLILNVEWAKPSNN